MLKDRVKMRRQGMLRERLAGDMYDESRWPTEVHGELDSASVQLQSQGVRWLLGGGGHEQAVRPLRHEAQRQVLGLCVHGDRHDDLQVHAAVITQHSRLWIGGEGEDRSVTKWVTHNTGENAYRGVETQMNLDIGIDITAQYRQQSESI